MYLLAAISCQKSDVSILEALEISGLGMLLIMCVLALLMGFIYALSAIIKKMEKENITFKSVFSKIKKNGKPEEVAPEVVAVQASPANAKVAPGSAGDIKLNGVPEATAAMVMAIVADELGTPVNELHFISIKEVEE